MIFADTLTLDAPRKTQEGFLVATVRAARTGIQEYSGREVDPENKHGFRDKAVVRVYRDEAEVFHADSLRSFSVLDVTVDHPSEAVNSKNWSKYAVGVTGEEVVRDGQFLRIPMMLKDQSAIDAVEAGKNQLSVGYDTQIVWESGQTADGLTYDAKQTKIRANHISVVGLARGGPELRIGDSQVATKTITFDGLPLEITDAGEAAINKLLGQVQKLTADAATAKTASDTALAAADAKVAKVEAERDAALAKVLDGAALDERVAARAALIASARAIHDGDYKGTDAEIRKAVVVAKLGDAAIAGKSEAYIDARFDILAEEAKAHDAVAGVIRNSPTAPSGQSAVIAASFKAADSMNDWRTKN